MPKLSGRYVSLVVVAMMLAGSSILAQVAATPAVQALGTSGTNDKAMGFDVVSIRPSDRQSSMHEVKITPGGYRTLGMPLLRQITDAYPPQMSSAVVFTLNHVKGYPSWLEAERYDIDARVSDADRAEWQRSAVQPAILRAMLRRMFEERCQLKVHREVKEGDVYWLIVGKNGPKLKATDPDAVTPPGTSLSGGGVLFFDQAKGALTVHGATIQSFLALLSSMGSGERPIEDRTGLTGKYDFTDKPSPATNSAPNKEQGTGLAPDPEPGFASFVKKLGLELVPAKGQVETLVIDHVERPSAN